MAPLVCLVANQSLKAPFAATGAEIFHLPGDPGVMDIGRALDEAPGGPLKPDLLVQVESLGERTLLAGVDKLDCPTVFWSIDTHLNLFWQEWYAGLFDLALTTQDHLRGDLAVRGARTGWLPWFGRKRPFAPHAERSRALGFVGRLTPDRPARSWFAELLTESAGLEVETSLGPLEMFDFYADTRIVPNETIQGEINFRLFEAASCGCLALTPELGRAQEILFTPDSEIALYRDSLELVELARFYRDAPDRSEAMGRAAWERVNREHLGVHRARALIEQGLALPGVARKKSRAGLALAAFELWSANRLPINAPGVETLLAEAQPSDAVRAALMRLAHATGRKDLCRRLLAEWSARKRSMASLELSLAASMACLALDDFSSARTWLKGHLASRGNGPRRYKEPLEPAGLLTLWAKELRWAKRPVRPGFTFSASRHLPASAAECLLLALDFAPTDQDLMRRLEILLAPLPGATATRLSLLSHLSLHNPEDWRTGLKLGLADLAAFRPAQGIEEIELARRQAALAGKEQNFFTILEGNDPSGLARTSLVKGRGRTSPKVSGP